MNVADANLVDAVNGRLRTREVASGHLTDQRKATDLLALNEGRGEAGWAAVGYADAYARNPAGVAIGDECVEGAAGLYADDAGVIWTRDVATRVVLKVALRE